MSAAEKLRALGERLNRFDTSDDRLALRDALPQIVAVVEAAQAIVQAEDDWDVYAKTPALDAALAALDEKLNGAETSPTSERT